MLEEITFHKPITFMPEDEFYEKMSKKVLISLTQNQKPGRILTSSVKSGSQFFLKHLFTLFTSEKREKLWWIRKSTFQFEVYYIPL